MDAIIEVRLDMPQIAQHGLGRYKFPETKVNDEQRNETRTRWKLLLVDVML